MMSVFVKNWTKFSGAKNVHLWLAPDYNFLQVAESHEIMATFTRKRTKFQQANNVRYIPQTDI